EGGSIVVAARKEDATLLLDVADTGLGLPFGYSEIKTCGTGAPGSRIGNANVRDRILAVYGPGAAFTLEPNQPAGVVARLSLPLSLSLSD
ncbi:sensor histidine kinase, partial [Undibacterium sp.]|uniref:sensor histidine kinase n=1 Tax=Undibacterium sp. TaxID=1914977 RepID=UPI002C54DBAE|nr:sensor histidine kinase [Undibacterium sp.]